MMRNGGAMRTYRLGGVSTKKLLTKSFGIGYT